MGRCKDELFTDTPNENYQELLGEDLGYESWSEKYRKESERIQNQSHKEWVAEYEANMPEERK